MNQQDALNYVKATIKTGDRDRIREVIDRYREKYWKTVDEAYDTAKGIFETDT